MMTTLTNGRQKTRRKDTSNHLAMQSQELIDFDFATSNDCINYKIQCKAEISRHSNDSQSQQWPLSMRSRVSGQQEMIQLGRNELLREDIESCLYGLRELVSKGNAMESELKRLNGLIRKCQQDADFFAFFRAHGYPFAFFTAISSINFSAAW